MRKLEQKYLSKMEAYHTLLEKENVKDELLDVYNLEFVQLREFYQNVDYSQIEHLSRRYNISFEPILYTFDLLNQIKVSIKKGEQSLKFNIRKLLINSLYLKQPIPDIFLFLKVSQDSIDLIFKQDLQTQLKAKLSKYPLDFTLEYKQFYENLIDAPDHVLISLAIELIIKTFDSLESLNTLKEKQFEVFEQFYNQFKTINFSYSKSIVQKIAKQINIFNRLKQRQYDLVSTKCEKFPQFILKFLLMLLRQKEIVIPELLHYIYFRNLDNKLSLAIRASVKDLNRIFEIPQVKGVLHFLGIDHNIFNRGIQAHEQVYKKCQIDYPHFLKMKLNGALIQYIEYLDQVSIQYRDRILTVYDDIEFKDLLTKIWEICGQEIQQILQNIVSEEIEYAKFGTNALRIGTFLYRIKFKLEKQSIKIQHQNLRKSDPLTVNKPLSIIQEQSYSKRTYRITEKNMTPLFKTFITKLVYKKTPYPFLLKNLKVKMYSIQVGYKTEKMKELINDPKFKKFMKKTHGVTWDKEESDENLNYIVSRQYPQPVNGNGKKYELNWPKLIKKQQSLKQQLINVYENQQFQKLYGDLINLNDNDKIKMQTKEILMNLVYYIQTYN